jgi:hypothetical protein
MPAVVTGVVHCRRVARRPAAARSRFVGLVGSRATSARLWPRERRRRRSRDDGGQRREHGCPDGKRAERVPQVARATMRDVRRRQRRHSRTDSRRRGCRHGLARAVICAPFLPAGSLNEPDLQRRDPGAVPVYLTGVRRHLHEIDPALDRDQLADPAEAERGVPRWPDHLHLVAHSNSGRLDGDRSRSKRDDRRGRLVRLSRRRVALRATPGVAVPLRRRVRPDLVLEFVHPSVTTGPDEEHEVGPGEASSCAAHHGEGHANDQAYLLGCQLPALRFGLFTHVRIIGRPRTIHESRGRRSRRPDAGAYEARAGRRLARGITTWSTDDRAEQRAEHLSGGRAA